MHSCSVHGLLRTSMSTITSELPVVAVACGDTFSLTAHRVHARGAHVPPWQCCNGRSCQHRRKKLPQRGSHMPQHTGDT